MPSVYISYSRRSDYSFIQELLKIAKNEKDRPELQSLVAEQGKEAKRTTLPPDPPANIDLDQWMLIYDENGLKQLTSICGFMDELSEGERIIFLLSRGYFQSPYCLTELLAIYGKRAGDLVPIVAFVDGFSPGDCNLSTLLAYWQNWPTGQDNCAQDLAPEQLEARKRFAKRIMRRLPAAHAWLLGRYDKERGGWDTLFPVVQADEKEQAAREVLDLLGQLPEPRFAFVSASQKRARVVAGMNKVMKGKQTAHWFEQLGEEFPIQERTDTSLAARLVDCATSKGDAFSGCLGKILDWLEDVLLDTEPGEARRQLATAVKEMLGWLLLMVIDDGRLHELVHELNRLANKARMELCEENDASYQIIASALSGVAAHYAFSPDSGLRGKGRIDLLEQGADPEKYGKMLEDEAKWFDIKTRMFKEWVHGGHRTEDSLDGAIKYKAGRKDAYHLVIDPSLLDIASCTKFMDMMADKFPGIHHIVARSDALDSTSAYCREEIEIGAIAEGIREIYKKIHELSQ